MTDKQQAQSIFRNELLRIAGWFTVCIVAGYLFDQMDFAVILALLCILARYAFVIAGLVTWLFAGAVPQKADDHLLGLLMARIDRSVNKQQQRRRQAASVARGFRDLLQRLPDAIVLIGKDESIEWMNDKASTFLPLRRNDLGHQITALIRKPDFIDFLESKDYVTTRVIYLQTDKSRYLRVQRVHYSDTSDLLVFRNITRIYRTQQQLVSFIAHASHEINTPLTVIKGYTELAQSELDEGHRAGNALDKVVEQTDKLAALTRDLLTLVSIDKQSQSQDTWFKPSDVLRTVLAQVKAVSHQPQRLMQLNIDDTILLNARQSHIGMLFTNIVENACKYSPVDTYINVSWYRQTSGSVIFTVVDHGVGIAQQHVDRLTERFYRVSQEEGQDPGGSGLGLSIVQAIMDLYKGELLIESKKGLGSSFSCIFPSELVTSV